MLPADFIKLSDSPISGKKRAATWHNFVFDKHNRTASVAVQVRFFNADPDSADGYGTEIITNELKPFTITLTATDQLLVNPVNGIHVDTLITPGYFVPEQIVTPEIPAVYGDPVEVPEVPAVLDEEGNIITPAVPAHNTYPLITPAVPAVVTPAHTVPEIITYTDKLGNSVLSPVGQFTFFTSLLNQAVNVNSVITQNITVQDTVYRKFDK